MNRIFVRPALFLAAALSTVACRSAFAPEPVTRLSEAPQAQHEATIIREAAVRTGPDRLAPVVHQLAAGATVTASDKSVRGFRRVRTADGRSGYVEEAAVQVNAAAAPAQQAAPAPAASESAAPAPATEPAPQGGEPSAAR